MAFLRAVVAVVALGSCLANAESWPEKLVRLIIPYPPGGSTDVAARVVAEKLSKALGQQFVVENRGGAGGAIGTAEVARAAPDGYTLLFAANQASTMHLVIRDMQYDMQRDFVPITQVTTQPNAIAVHPSLGVSDLQGLIALAKASPGKLSYAHPGPGSGQQMTGDLLWKMAGVKIVGVPYKGGGQAVVDLLAGHVPIALLGATPFIPYHRAGRIRIIAFTSAERFPVMPEIPTLADAGFKGIDSTQWLGILAPRGTPSEIVQRVYTETAKALALPDVREKLAQAALQPVGNTPEQFAAVIKSEDDAGPRSLRTWASNRNRILRMRIRLLGTGTPTPSLKRMSSGYLVETGDRKILFDFGPGAYHRMMEAGVRATEITDVFLTHLHYDHCLDLIRLVMTRWDQGAGRIPELNVYGPRFTARMTELIVGEEGIFGPDLEARTELPMSQAVFVARGGTLPRARPWPVVRELASGEVVDAGSFTVEVRAVLHAQPILECFAYRLEADGVSFAYSGDAGPCKAMRELARDCDVLVHMCHFLSGTGLNSEFEKRNMGHLELARLGAEANVRNLVVSHVAEQLDRPGVRERVIREMSEIYRGNLFFGEDLMEIPASVPTAGKLD